MKKTFFLFLVLISSTILLNAQSEINYKQIDREKTDDHPKDIFQDKDGNVYVLFIDKLNFTKNQGVWLYKFSPTFDFLSRIDIKGDLPDFFYARILLDHVCIISINVTGQSKVPSYVMFYDFTGNFIKKIELDPTFNYSKLFGTVTPTFGGVTAGSPGYSSNDKFRENYNNFKITKDNKIYFVWGMKEIKAPKAETKHEFKVYVFDLNLEKIAEETFMFEDVFANTSELYSLEFDVTPKNKIIGFCENYSLPNNAQLNIAVFNNPGEKPIIHKYTFPSGGLHFAYNFGNNDEIFISGVGVTGSPLQNRSTDKYYFFINQSLISTEPATPRVFDIEKQIYTAYPDCEDNLRKTTMTPFEIFVMNDGIICGSTHIASSYSNASNETTDYATSLVFIKYSFTGEIQWLKMVNKRVLIEYPLNPYTYFCYLKDNDNVKIIYPDYYENILDGKNKFYKSDETKALAITKVSTSGNISTQVFHKNDDTKFRYFLSKSIFSKDGIISLAVSFPKLLKQESYLVEIKYP